jgi:hypothetical protein
MENKSKQDQILTGNVLTKDLVATMFESIKRNKTTGGLSLTEQDLTDVFYTIWAINSTPAMETKIKGTEVLIDGYKIPKCLESLYVGPVSLTGTKDEIELLDWVISDEVKGRVLTKREMLDIAQSLYSSQRKEAAFIDVNHSVITPISNFKTRLADQTSVCINFSNGAFPIVAKYDFVKPRFMGMDKSLAIDEFIVDVINRIKN